MDDGVDGEGLDNGQRGHRVHVKLAAQDPLGPTASELEVDRVKALAPSNPAPFPLAFAIGWAEATAAVALEQDFACIDATSVGGGNGGTRLTGCSSFASHFV